MSNYAVYPILLVCATLLRGLSETCCSTAESQMTGPGVDQALAFSPTRANQVR